MKWSCCQLGAREHYSVPRALLQAGEDPVLVTDAWTLPGSVWGRLPGRVGRRLRERYHPGLAGRPVRAWNRRLVLWELAAGLRRDSGWRRVQARNRWFQRLAAQAVEQERAPVVFSYSYTALEVFRRARARGGLAILGQIDPGEAEERLMAGLVRDWPGLAPGWEPAPPEYWRDWRAECDLADMILVNSDWSRQGLVSCGIPESKLRVVPLAFEPPAEAAGFVRNYPRAFSAARPLRVLFLGQINLRKGAHVIFETIRRMSSRPVEWWMVGPVQIQVAADVREHPAVRWEGAVPRGQAAQFYREADVFVFPTLSDGFGLTQLEAMAWRLPVIASAFCGRVVQDGVNGLGLDPVTPEALAGLLERCLFSPSFLAGLSENCALPSGFGLPTLGAALCDAARGRA